MVPIKILCGCGQKYAFDIEPVNGRMPHAVNCPACGADGTTAANEIIAYSLPPSRPAGPGINRPSASYDAPIAAPKIPPHVNAASGKKRGLLVPMLVGGLVVLLAVGGLYFSFYLFGPRGKVSQLSNDSLPLAAASPPKPVAGADAQNENQTAPPISAPNAQRLKELEDIYNQGLISKEIYDQKRQQILNSPSNDHAGQGVVFLDAFGNPLGTRGIALVDWDGYMANPAVKLTLTPAPDIQQFPARVTISATEPRMYFDSPSKIGANGPSKTITFRDASDKVVVYLSVFPSREAKDEDQLLRYEIVEAGGMTHNGNINVHVFDQDENRPSPFKVTVDFSYDESGLFSDPVKRQIAQQAADDWAYFIDGMNPDPVPTGGERIWIYPPVTDFSSPTLKPNPAGYAGFLLELYGVDDPQLRSGGAGSDQAFQYSHGVQLFLRRSGNVAVETKGNYNTLGWMLITKDNDWWMTDNFGNHQNDFYSIVHHEMGHALGFNLSYTLEKAAKYRGDFESAALLAYHGKYPKIDKWDHLAGEIDDASRVGAFGNEYHGEMPKARWLITKLDLLCLESIGYKIRRTFDLAVKTATLPDGSLDSHYSTTMQAKGGLPWYAWSVESGALPDGLKLDSDTGVISGQPTLAGTFTFNIRLTDSSEQKASVVSAPFKVAIR